jgi:hypothetical protein
MGESMSEIHMPDRTLADLMGQYGLNGSLRNGRAFMEAAMAYFRERTQTESAESIALAREQMGLRENGGGDL